MDYVSLIKSWKLNAVIKDRVKDYLVFRNSHQSCSIIKGVLKNFAKFRKNTCARDSIFVIYWIFAPCFLFGPASWLFRKKCLWLWKIGYLGWTMLPFHWKWRTRLLGLKHVVVFFRKTVANSNISINP